MTSKLPYRIPSENKENSKRIQKIDCTKQRGIREMYFDTSSTKHNDFLLLPDEYCLAEDEKNVFHVHSEREGFHLFGWGNIHFTNIHGKIYLTNYRVYTPPKFHR